MKKHLHVLTTLSVAIGLCMGSSLVLADTAPTTQTASTSGQESSRLAASYTTFAGSATNAQSLVTGLRSGTAIVLVTPATATTPAVQTTFTPSTHPLGYGNVNISLALAQAELKAAGITQPTAAQLEAALNGGTVTGPKGPVQLTGVLALRAEGQGWGAIAKTLNLKLGDVMSAAKAHGPVPDSADIAHGDNSDKASHADKADKIAKVDHPDKADRPDKPDHPDKPEKPERPDKPERGGR
ncbi:hypothetical protein [Dyella jiangningensis]|uniref:Uncharacterized protein n=1 Tax=Dyella jiangningensis TaxID=1379159 RepID=A0A328P7H5_9GAMM|nr:hypothetical protein [Dyella jiangningensis]RAO77273.1 hypothetical protein CA260_05140 [Dyella jiangningensis]